MATGSALDVMSRSLDPTDVSSEYTPSTYMNVSMADVSTTELTDLEVNTVMADRVVYIFYICIGCLGCPANIMVVVVILNYPTMRKLMTNMYIVNQSLIDASVALFLVLTTVFQSGGTLVRGNAADESYCRLWLTKMPLWGMLVSSTYNLLALTFERYLAVVYPIWHKINFNKSKLLVSITIVWVIGPLYNFAYMYPTAAVLPEGACTVFNIYPNLPTRRFVGILTIIIQYFVPLAVLVFCYGQMAWVLHKRVEVDHKGSDNHEIKRNESMARARGNVIKTLAMVAFSFIFCWTWNQIYYLLYNTGYEVNFTSAFYHFTVVLVFCNCCINPFIYIFKYDQFQKGLRRLFRVHSARVGGTGDSSVNTTAGD